jgi:hypothetical protein
LNLDTSVIEDRFNKGQIIGDADFGLDNKNNNIKMFKSLYQNSLKVGKLEKIFHHKKYCF